MWRKGVILKGLRRRKKMEWIVIALALIGVLFSEVMYRKRRAEYRKPIIDRLNKAMEK
jgi:hypothetical protein